jgi:hypothetical protein
VREDLIQFDPDLSHLHTRSLTLKAYGMDRMPTPIRLFTKVVVASKVVIMGASSSSSDMAETTKS